MKFSFEKCRKIKNPSKETLDGFEYILMYFYFNKSSTNEGNKPKAMFKPIEITATA